MEKYGVDLVFNAHDHAIARTYPIKNGVFMKRPSQGVIYYLAGQSGGKTYQGREKNGLEHVLLSSGGSAQLLCR